MKTLQSSLADVDGKLSWKGLLVLFFFGSCTMLSVRLRDKLLMGHDAPGWIRLAVVAAPWLVYGLCLLFYRRVIWRPDEMHTVITHRAMVFAFYVMIIGVLMIDELQMARLIPVFEWTADRLFMTMVGLLLSGSLWNWVRISW